jgi:hypothetical protein
VLHDCSKAVKSWIEQRGAKNAVVVGGGFIGIEMVENLVHRGLKTTLLEMQTQVRGVCLDHGTIIQSVIALTVCGRVCAHGLELLEGFYAQLMLYRPLGPIAEFAVLFCSDGSLALLLLLLLLVSLPAFEPVQIMPPFDPEMVQPMQEKLKAKGVELCLGDSVKGFKADQVLRQSCMVLLTFI